MIQLEEIDYKKLSLTVVFIAVIFVFTLAIVLPIPATQGYFNIGEIGVYLAALIGGPFVGAVAGGVGSMLADLVSAPIYAPATLVVKGAEGYVTAKLFRVLKEKFQAKNWVAALSCAVGGAIMITGYFIYEIFLTNLASALAEVPYNVFQVIVGIVVAVPVYFGLLRMGYNVED